MAVVCMDTQMLIWAIQGTVREGQTDMPVRTHALLHSLVKEKATVVISSVTIGEFMIGIPVAEHARYMQLINRRFVVAPYDLRASMLFSKIWHTNTDKQMIEEVKQTGITKTHLRADTMVVATALAIGATRLYGHDNGFKRLSHTFIEFINIKDVVLQAPLLPP